MINDDGTMIRKRVY